jgi:hypothetical protein
MRTDEELLDFFALLCRRAQEKYGLPDDYRSWQHLENLEAVRRGMRQGARQRAKKLTGPEKDRLGELMIARAVERQRLLDPISHFVAEDCLPRFAVWYGGLVVDRLEHGPAHFREQAEARLAEIVGPEMAAQLCGMNDSK